MWRARLDVNLDGRRRRTIAGTMTTATRRTRKRGRREDREGVSGSGGGGGINK